MKIRFAFALLVGLLVAFFPGLAARAYAGLYHLIDLGPGTATAISQSGDAAGYSGPEAVYWSGGIAHDIGPGKATGINDSDQVVGTSATTHAFLYSGGKLTNLGTLPGGTFSYAAGINNAGQIAGTSGLPANIGIASAFRYSNGVMTPLGTIGNESGGSYAYGINASGQVVGQANSPTGYGHAFMTPAGGSLAIIDLRTLDGGSRSTSTAKAISDSGEVVGVSGSHAFSTLGGPLMDLGVGQAYGVNDAGQILGVNVSISLDSSGAGWSNVFPAAINNAGEIAGSATAIDGVSHAVLLVPTVPEPSSLILALIATLLAVVGWRLRSWSPRPSSTT